MARPDWFQFGDGYLSLSSAHAEFRERFLDLYRECTVDAPPPDTSTVVRCDVQGGDAPGSVRVDFDDPEPLDQIPVALASSGEISFREVAPPQPDWRALSAEGFPGCIAFSGASLVADLETPWQSLVGVLAVHRVLRLQRQTLFFHAATIGIDGKGLLLFGPKTAGKTTLSLALADRGHTLLGDEIAALRLKTLELLPFRRRIAIRQGPRSAGVDMALARRANPTIDLPDGTTRTRVHARTLFPTVTVAPVPAQVMVFLRSRSDVPQVERFTPRFADLKYLQPFESVVWSASRGSVAVRLLSLLGRLPCYFLDAGGIEDTALVLEALMEDA